MRHAHIFGLRAIKGWAERRSGAKESTLGALPEGTAIAPAAMTAGREIGREDTVTLPDALHGGTDLRNFSDELMAEDGAGCDARKIAVNGVQIGTANTRQCDVHDGVGRFADNRLWDVGYRDFARTLKNDGFHGDEAAGRARCAARRNRMSWRRAGISARLDRPLYDCLTIHSRVD